MPLSFAGVRHRARDPVRVLRSLVRDIRLRPSALVGPRSGVAPPAPSAFRSFGQGSWIVPPAEVIGAAHVAIGDGVVLLEHAVLRADEGSILTIEDRVRLGRGVWIHSRNSIHVGMAVASSDHVAIVDHWESSHAGDLPSGPVVIEDGAYLGYGSYIGPGVTVGTGAFVGEGAVVLEDVAPNTVVYGNPARVTRSFDATTRSWSGPRFP